jgi:hypothetical protein
MYRIEISRFKLLIMRDLSRLEAGKTVQKHRVAIFKLLIMQDLSFSGRAKRRKKYRIEIGVPGVGELGGTSGSG